jgi:uncharacterized cupin superfamily protein
VYVLKGKGRVWIDGETYEIGPNDCIGFPAGRGVAHTFINDGVSPGSTETRENLVLLIMGDNKPGDKVYYPYGEREVRDKMAREHRWWRDVPKRSLGSHDGWPLYPLKTRGPSDTQPQHSQQPTNPLSEQPHTSKPAPNPIWHRTLYHAPVLAGPVDSGVLSCELAHLSTLTNLSGRVEIQLRSLRKGKINQRPTAWKLGERFVYILGGRGKLWQDGELWDIKEGDGVGWIGGTGVAHAIWDEGLGDVDVNGEAMDLALLEINEIFEDDQAYMPLEEDQTREKSQLIAEGKWWADAPTRKLGDETLPSFDSDE